MITTQSLTRRCPDLLVTKDSVGLDVSGAATDILSDCLDTLRVNDSDSVEIDDILWLRIAMVFWDATKKCALHSCNTVFVQNAKRNR